MLRWYLVHTKPSAERLAQANLERQAYEVYCPRVLQPMRRRDRWRDAIVPLFPRYLFLRLSEGLQPLAPVRSTIGVAGIVKFGVPYAIVPDEVVQGLRSRADPVSGLHRLKLGNLFKPGGAVRVAVGAFSGLEGVLEREAGNDRVQVLLNLLGRDVPVRIPSGFVVPSLAAS